MNTTLLLRLDGPLQSWGASPSAAATAIRFPTATNLIGMIATAVGSGRGRGAARLDFVELAVRADEPGRCVSDFQEPRQRRSHPATATEEARFEVLRRGFAADAVFIAAMVGGSETVELAASALARPGRQLFLGRRCCPPAAPILLGLSDRPALAALGTVPYQGHRELPPAYFDVVIYSQAHKERDTEAAGPAGAQSRRDWVRTDTAVSAKSALALGMVTSQRRGPLA